MRDFVTKLTRQSLNLLSGAPKGRHAYLGEFSKRRSEIDQIYRMRLEHVVDVNQPLVLISQIQRSGGSMLSQLFDGHPQCHMHPSELTIGFPKKWHWPELDLGADPESWFKRLFEQRSLRHFREGYFKHSPRFRADDAPERFPFLILPSLQKEIFLEAVSSTEIHSQRDVLNCYMTAYFNSWLDYQGLYRPVKYVVAFLPRLNMMADSMARFFADYPDGRLISAIRNPKTWFQSASKHSPEAYSDLKTAIDLWKASAQATLDAKQRYGERVQLLCYEDLLRDAEGCMRRLATALGIDFCEILTLPTFQGMPIKANSSFAVSGYGVRTDSLTRADSVEMEGEAYVAEQATPLYEKVVDEARSQA